MRTFCQGGPGRRLGGRRSWQKAPNRRKLYTNMFQGMELRRCIDFYQHLNDRQCLQFLFRIALVPNRRKLHTNILQGMELRRYIDFYQHLNDRQGLHILLKIALDGGRWTKYRCLRTKVDVRGVPLDGGRLTKYRACAQELMCRVSPLMAEGGPSTAPARKSWCAGCYP